MREGQPQRDDLSDRTPIVPAAELEAQLRRYRLQRRWRLLALWAAVVLLLALQGALATRLRRQRLDRVRSSVLAAGAASTAARTAPTVPALPRLAASVALPAAGPATRPPLRETRPRAVASSRPAVAPEPRPSPREARPLPRQHVGKRAAAQRAQHPRPGALPVAAGPIDDITVPPRLSGDAGRGERLFRMGCALCHAPVNPGRFSARQWSAFFARGLHGRHTKLRARFTRSELADVKTFLTSAAGGH